MMPNHLLIITTTLSQKPSFTWRTNKTNEGNPRISNISKHLCKL